MILTATEQAILRKYVAKKDFAAIARECLVTLDQVTATVTRVNFQRPRAAEVLRQFAAGVPVSLAPLVTAREDHAAPAAPPAKPAPRAAATPAPADPPAAPRPQKPEPDEPAEVELTPAPEPPRRTQPRTAEDALVTPAASSGGDADQVVTADRGPAEAVTTTFDLASERTTQTPATFLDPDLLFAHAVYVSTRWYCPRCHEWPLDPGACATCRAPLQAVYHATIPREIT